MTTPTQTGAAQRRRPSTGQRRWRSKIRALLVTPLLAGVLLSSPRGASSDPSSFVAWTPETLSLVQSGDPASGAELAVGCSACHGSDSDPAIAPYPRLAGQDAAYIYKQLHDFKSGTRDNAPMRSFASYLSEQEMADIAAYYAAITPAAAENPLPPAEAPELALYGDGPRLIPACNACHGDGGAGNARSHGMPVLAGQTAQYLTATLLLYNGGYRENDVYRVMRTISAQLTVEEIKSLTLYFASMSGEGS
jgi:cytochrome c553